MLDSRKISSIAHRSKEKNHNFFHNPKSVLSLSLSRPAVGQHQLLHPGVVASSFKKKRKNKLENIDQPLNFVLRLKFKYAFIHKISTKKILTTMRFINHGGMKGLFYHYEVYKSWWYERVVLLLLSGKGLWADSYHTT